MTTTGKMRLVEAGKDAFTILELLVVVAIIGLMAKLALPHLAGFTRSNTVSTASQQFVRGDRWQRRSL